MGWIFNTIVAANITGEATHRRATCGNASNPCTIKAVSVIGVARSTSCRGRYIGESPSRGEGFGAGQSRPVVLMSVLGGDRDGCGRTRPCDFACGLFAPHRDRLILAPPLAAPDRQVALPGYARWPAWWPGANQSCCIVSKSRLLCRAASLCNSWSRSTIYATFFRGLA